MKKHWDNTTSPSTYVISRSVSNGKYRVFREVFRGGYVDGMMYIKSLDNGGMISFASDYLPVVGETAKRAYRALMAQKELRREIIKLKKQIGVHRRG